MGCLRTVSTCTIRLHCSSKEWSLVHVVTLQWEPSKIIHACKIYSVLVFLSLSYISLKFFIWNYLSVKIKITINNNRYYNYKITMMINKYFLNMSRFSLGRISGMMLLYF